MHSEQPIDRPAGRADIWSDVRLHRSLRLAILVAFALFYAFSPTKDDISVLLSAGNALLDGQRLYIDVLEANPPMSTLIYLPAVLAERATGLRAEVWVIVETLLAAIGTLRLSATILTQGGLPPRREWFLTAGTLVMVALPLGVFGQRDHIAMMAALPLVAALAVPAPRQVRRRYRMAAGLCAGLAMCIKPQFALVFALPALGSALRDRRIGRLLQMEVGVAATVVIGFWSIAYVAFPGFFTVMLPIITELYRPLHADRLTMLWPTQPAGLTLVLLVLVLRPLGRGAGGRWPVALALAALGFLGAFIEQAKGWPYHLYPAVALTVFLGLTITLPTVVSQSTGYRRLATAWSIGFLLFLIWCLRFFLATWTDYSTVVEAIRSTGIRHPRILCITASHGLCHPVTRDAGGSSAGTLASRWLTVAAISGGNLGLPSGRSGHSVADWVEIDRRYLRTDIAYRQPDIIVVQRGDAFDWLAWAEEDPAIRATLASRYTVARRLPNPEGDGNVEIWKRSQEGG